MEMVFTFTLVPPPNLHPGHLSPFASIYYLPSVIVNFSVCSVLLSIQLCPPLSPFTSPPRFSRQLDLKSMWFCKWEVHVVLTEDIHTELHTHTRIYKHKYDISTNNTEHMWSCGLENGKKKVGLKLAKMFGLG